MNCIIFFLSLLIMIQKNYFNIKIASMIFHRLQQKKKYVFFLSFFFLFCPFSYPTHLHTQYFSFFLSLIFIKLNHISMNCASFFIFILLILFKFTGSYGNVGSSNSGANIGIGSVGECRDYTGRTIQHAMHFVPPGPDMCKLCICENGHAKVHTIS